MGRIFTRRKLLASSAAVGATALLAKPALLWAQSAPIKLGITVPISGAQQEMGKQQLLGAEIAVELLNERGGVMGRKVELIVRDDKADPKQGVSNANELADLGANLMLGGVQTALVLAVKPLLANLDSVFISTCAAADTLTTTDFTPNYFRITDSYGARSRGLALFVSQRYPNVKRWTALAGDAAFGRSAWEAFKTETSRAYDGNIEFADPVLFTFGSTDYRNQIAKLLTSPADGIYVIANGTDAITFYNQASAVGLLGRYEAIIDAGNETILANAMGDRIPKGLWTVSFWHPDLYQDIEPGRYLKQKAAQALGGEYNISGYPGPTFSAVMAYAAAIEKAGSTDTQKVIAALEGLSLETPKGPVTFRQEDHQAIVDVNFYQFEPQQDAPGWKFSDQVKIAGADAAVPAVARQ